MPYHETVHEMARDEANHALYYCPSTHCHFSSHSLPYNSVPHNESHSHDKSHNIHFVVLPQCIPHHKEWSMCVQLLLHSPLFPLQADAWMAAYFQREAHPQQCPSSFVYTIACMQTLLYLNLHNISSGYILCFINHKIYNTNHILDFFKKNVNKIACISYIIVVVSSYDTM